MAKLIRLIKIFFCAFIILSIKPTGASDTEFSIADGTSLNWILTYIHTGEMTDYTGLIKMKVIESSAFEVHGDFEVISNDDVGDISITTGYVELIRAANLDNLKVSYDENFTSVSEI